MFVKDEGNDKTKVKDLIKDIKKNIGVKSNRYGIKTTVKVERNNRLKK